MRARGGGRWLLLLCAEMGGGEAERQSGGREGMREVEFCNLFWREISRGGGGGGSLAGGVDCEVCVFCESV